MIETAEILKFLECPPSKPGIRHLNRLINAYVRKVPWESVFRIVKRASTPDRSQCPRWPDEFWQDAFYAGGGGTCFESNYAFFHLLQELGYRGYLTVNDMGEQRACHAAIVIHLDGRKVLVDVAIPIIVTLLIDPARITRRSTWLHTYTARPDGLNRYQILRSRHPKPNIYTLHDTPVSDADYCQILEQDYGEKGLFLNWVIIVKVIGDRLWRFSSTDLPYRLESLGQEGKQEISLSSDQVFSVLAERFRMDQAKIETAMQSLCL